MEDQRVLSENSTENMHNVGCDSETIAKMPEKHLGELFPSLEGKSKTVSSGKQNKTGLLMGDNRLTKHVSNFQCKNQHSRECKTHIIVPQQNTSTQLACISK